LFGYHARTFAGRVAYARIVGKRDFWTRNGKSTTRHFRLELDAGEAGHYSEDASERSYAHLSVGDVIALRGMRNGARLSLPCLGPTPTANAWGCVFGGLAIVLLFVGYNDARQSSRPWWDRPLMQRGAGRLAATATTPPPHDG
jgi:hypothetical protein